MQIVSFNSADKQLTLKNKTHLRGFIANIFDKENKPLKKLDYVFCSDDYLLQINKDFLQHDYYTDIITFPLSDKHQPIVGEVYISLDRVRDNAKLHGDSILNETLRVLFHGFVFRMLCDSGDEVLIAQPSYPLFDFLAELDDVRLVPYPLIYDHGWQMDEQSIRQRITSRTRAIVLVNPNNPTGHFTKPWEREMLEGLSREHGLSLIIDEVFLDYSFDSSAAAPSFAQGEAGALTFVLSGLSKVAGLPQMKAAWIACLGPQAERRQAQDRLEVIADTFLSMNAPVQWALPHWLATRDGIQNQIRARVRENLAALDEILAGQTLASRLALEGGWCAVLRIPSIHHDEKTAMALLAEGVSVHPGYFFGFLESGWLVISLLGLANDFRRGVLATLHHIEQESN